MSCLSQIFTYVNMKNTLINEFKSNQIKILGIKQNGHDEINKYESDFNQKSFQSNMFQNWSKSIQNDKIQQLFWLIMTVLIDFDLVDLFFDII